MSVGFKTYEHTNTKYLMKSYQATIIHEGSPNFYKIIEAETWEEAHQEFDKWCSMFPNTFFQDMLEI